MTDRSNNNPPTEYKLFTGGKVEKPEFTVFYNIAFFNVAEVVNHALGEAPTSKKELEEKFKKWVTETEFFLGMKTKGDETAAAVWTDAQLERTLTSLQNYLWKGKHSAKNASGNFPTPKERQLIVELCKKLEEIRDFHAHYYHDNIVLAFEADLCQAFNKWHTDAVEHHKGKKTRGIDKYKHNTITFFKIVDGKKKIIGEKEALSLESENNKKITIKEDDKRFFKIVDGKKMITPDGKTFFLSFFLTRGQMNNFLSQRDGYKRTQGAEFALTREIFTHYAQREGATRRHHAATADQFGNLTNLEQQEINNMRQFYKIVTSLNDTPTLWQDKTLFPLFLESGQQVQTRDEYVQFCAQKNIFSLDLKTCVALVKKEIEIAVADEVKEREAYQKHQEIESVKHEAKEIVAFFEKKRLPETKIKLDVCTVVKKISNEQDDTETTTTVTLDNYLAFKVQGYRVEVTLETLHGLILDTIRMNDNGNAVIWRLLSFVWERERFYKLICDGDYLHKQEEIKDNFELQKTFDEYKRYRLRNKNLTNQFEGVQTQLSKPQKDMTGLSIGEKLKKQELAEKKKKHEAEFKAAIRTKAIEVKYYDFCDKEVRKPRGTALFPLFTAQYWLQTQAVPNWYFLFEQYDLVETDEKINENGKPVVQRVMKNERVAQFYNTIPDRVTARSKNKKQKEYSRTLSSEPRLAMTDEGQITVGVYTESCDRSLPPTYLFALGHRAIKNVLIAQQDGKSIATFFDPIITDIQAIRANTSETVLTFDDLTVLGKNELPETYQKAMNFAPTNLDALRKKADTRLNHILNTLRPLTQSDTPEFSILRRNDKNEIIMRCYQYFNWTYDDKMEYKFLRKNEWKKLSQYHYLLDKRRNPDLENGTYKELLRDRSENHDILAHMPQSIKTWLRDARSFDDLFAVVVEKTIVFLNRNKKELPTMKTKDLFKLLGKLSIAKQQEQPRLDTFIPFAVHPILILKRFYPFKLVQTEKNGSADGLNIKRSSIAAALWQKEDKRKALVQTHYNYADYFKTMQMYQQDGKTFKPEYKKYAKYIIGAVNELLTEDILLWEIAKKHLQRMSSTYKVAVNMQKQAEAWQIQNLRNTTLSLKLTDLVTNDKVSDKKIPFSIGSETISNVILHVKFHNLDDYLFATSTEVIKAAVKQVLMRGLNKLTKEGKAYVVPYEEVFREKARVHQDSLQWAKYILQWEAIVIDSMSDAERAALADPYKVINECARIAFASDLIAKKDTDLVTGNEIKVMHPKVTRFLKQIHPIGTPYFDALKDLLTEVRNKTFHAEIPDGWAYWQLETEAKYEDLRDLLGYKKKEKKDYTNNNTNTENQQK